MSNSHAPGKTGERMDWFWTCRDNGETVKKTNEIREAGKPGKGQIKKGRGWMLYGKGMRAYGVDENT